MEKTITHTGQVIHIRKISKKLMFIDVRCEVNPRKTVVFNSWDSGPQLIVEATRSKSKIHVGDTVVFRGEVDSKDSQLLSCRSYSIIKSWFSENPEMAFIPKPPEKNAERVEGICKYFLNTGKCPKESCGYSHGQVDTSIQSTRQQYVADKKTRRMMEHEGDFSKEQISGSSQRAEIFAKWIIETWGLDYLSTGVILDVGGGRGDLSFELAVKLGLKCVIVDPRPSKLKRWQAKYLKKHPEVKTAEHIQDLFNTEFFKSPTSVAVSDVRLVVGLHPDEATEPLVDTSLEKSLDFCVIPCCVFSADNPHRRLKDGSIPTSYTAFCHYLMEKNSQVKDSPLPFCGRNKVIYRKTFRESSDGTGATL